MYTLDSNYKINGEFNSVEDARRYAEMCIRELFSEKYTTEREKARLADADAAGGDDIVLVVDEDRDIVEIISIPDVMGWERI